MPMPPPPLRVIAADGHLVADDVALQNGDRFRFVGRSPTRAKDLPPEPSLADMFPPAEREYPDDGNHRYLLRQIKKGALAPLDEHTAKRAGVPWKNEPKSAAKARKVEAS